MSDKLLDSPFNLPCFFLKMQGKIKILVRNHNKDLITHIPSSHVLLPECLFWMNAGVLVFTFMVTPYPVSVADPYLQITRARGRGQSFRPRDEVGGGGRGLKNFFFWPFGPQFRLKMGGGDLSWICHCVCSNPHNNKNIFVLTLQHVQPLEVRPSLIYHIGLKTQLFPWDRNKQWPVWIVILLMMLRIKDESQW